MPDLNFAVEGAAPERFAAVPLLIFKLRVTQAAAAGLAPAPIHSVVLRCQIRIEPARRRYTPVEKATALELFGTPERWGQTLRPHALDTRQRRRAAVHRRYLRRSSGAVQLRLQSWRRPSTSHGLDDGEIPLCFLFSGTIFYRTKTVRCR